MGRSSVSPTTATSSIIKISLDQAGLAASSPPPPYLMMVQGAYQHYCQEQHEPLTYSHSSPSDGATAGARRYSRQTQGAGTLPSHIGQEPSAGLRAPQSQ